jgi:hypothetical protein
MFQALCFQSELVPNGLIKFVLKALILAPWAALLLACVLPNLRRMLWACRVSVVSALGGYLLFSFVVQAQDLLADTTYGSQPLLHLLFWTFVFASVFLVWAFPVHYAARDILDEGGRAWFFSPREIWESGDVLREGQFGVVAGRCDFWFIKWLPRILGALPFVAIFVGLLSSLAETAHATSLVPCLRLQYLLLTLGDAAAFAIYLIFMVYRKGLAVRYARMLTAIKFEYLSIVITFAVLLTLVVFPFFGTGWVFRTALIPYLFGGGVLLFARVTKLSHKHAQPLLLYFFAAITLLTAFNWSFNEIRTLTHSTEVDAKFPLDKRQMEFAEAVKKWRLANDCAATEQDDAAAREKCPPALIIAADGGASRAAFFTATVVGEILDLSESVASGTGKPGPANRIFAMSGVSGGSVGLAAIKAALIESDGSPPCTRSDAKSWRKCLQLLVDGDYLSPDFVGLGYRDNFAPPIPPFNDPEFWGDRGALMEQSWERHYLKQTRSSGESLKCGRGLDERGLCRPFGYPAQMSRWVPLLLLNGTSVQSGRRTIASEFKSVRSESPDPKVRPPLYQWAYDVFEMMSVRCRDEDFQAQVCNQPSPQSLEESAPDIRLSTAALTSARFPLISPAGAIWMKDGKHGDEIVDGGYFENSGLSTALDIASAINQFGVRPVIVSIANDPRPKVESPLDLSRVPVLPNRFGAGPSIEISKWTLINRAFGTFYAPAVGLFATRGGHADEAASLVTRALQSWNVPSELKAEDFPKYASFFPIRVFAAPKITGEDFEMRNLSMSWWLSPVVRCNLNEQLIAAENRTQFELLIKRLYGWETKVPEADRSVPDGCREAAPS